MKTNSIRPGVRWAPLAGFFFLLPAAAPIAGQEAGEAQVEAERGGGRPPVTRRVPPGARLTVSPAELTLEVGGKAALTATVVDRNGESIPGVDVVFFSRDRSRLVVSPAGAVEAHGPGEVTVVALVPREPEDGPQRAEALLQAEIDVTIPNPPVGSVEIVGLPGAFHAGTRLTLQSRLVDITDVVRDDVEVTWMSSNAKVAAPDGFGGFDLLSPGRATLTAAAGPATAQAAISVGRNPVERFELTASAAEARTGDVVRFSAVGLDASGNEVEDLPIRYEVAGGDTTGDPPGDGAGIGARIEEDGAFVAERSGVYTVTATTGSHSASLQVQVTPRQVTRKIEFVGQGKVHDRQTTDLWVWEGTDGRDYAITGTSRGDGDAHIWDVTDPAKIVRLHTVRVDARTVNDVKVSEDGRIAVISREGASTRKNGIVVLDVSRPRSGVPILSRFDDQLWGGVHNVFIYDDHVYAVSSDRRFEVINIEDPSRPYWVSRFELATWRHRIHDVWVVDGVAFSSNWRDGVVAVDVGGAGMGGAPNNPVQLGSYTYPSGWNHAAYPYHSKSTGKFYVFAGDEAFPYGDPGANLNKAPPPAAGWIHVISWDDWKNPREVARYRVPGAGSHNMWIEDDIMYVAFYNGGLRVVDVSGEMRGDLERQGREIGVYLPRDSDAIVPNSPYVWGPQLHKGNIFFSDWLSGLWAVKLEGSDTPASAGSGEGGSSPTRPAQPTGLTATAGNAQVTLRWSDPGDAGITGYKVRYGRRSERGNAGWTAVFGAGASTTSHTLRALDNGSTYSFKVRAVNGAGDSDASDWVTATPTPVPRLQLLSDPAAVTEGTAISLAVASDRALAGDLTVSLTLRNRDSGSFSSFDADDIPGTLGPRDFTASFGETASATGTVTIPTSADSEAESAETYTIKLNDGDGYARGGDRTADGTLNDGTVSLSIADVSAAEDGTFAFTVTAVPSPSAEVTFKYTATAESGDTATADTDFSAVATATAATIAANASSTTITVAVTDDGLDEDAETFTVTLSDPSSGVTLGDATATGTITDDDESPVLSTMSDRTVPAGQVVSITAAATDGDSDPITYAWTRKSDETLPALPGGTALNQARLTFTPPSPGAYTLTVTASDGNGNSDTYEVVVTVTAAPEDDGNDGGDAGGPADGGGGNPPGGGGGNPPAGGGGNPPGGGGGNPPGGGGSPPSGGGSPPGGGGGPSGAPDGGDGDDGEDPDDADDEDDGGPGGNGGGFDGSGGPVRAAFTLETPCVDGLCRARTGAAVSFQDTSSGAVTRRTWDFGDGTTSRSRSPERAWSAPGFYTVSLTVSGRDGSATVSRTLLIEAADPAGTCTADSETLCLQDSRFSVTMDWWTADGADARRGAGKVVHEGTNDSGLFWFFSAVNWELLVKVLDGCSVNGRMWVYGASATTLGYSLKVTDTVTGAVQEYRNEPGEQAEAFTDSAAFPGSCTDAATAAAAAGGSLPVTEPAPEPPPAQQLAAATSVTAAAEDSSCTETAKTMCLQKGRYEVTVTWSNLEGARGPGRVAGPRTDDSGLFHFFSPANWEILVKVLDGCAVNRRHWVFAASATDVGFDLQVRDTATGRTRHYTKQPGKPARALVDASAFPDACTQ